MSGPTSIAAACAVACIVLFGSAAAEDMRCAELDRVAVTRLRIAIDHTDAHSTLTALTAVSQLGWARLDCREGRTDRGIAAYRQLIEALAVYEASLHRRLGDRAAR